MRPFEILVLYLLIGLGVGLSQHRTGRPGALLSVPFWPLFLPTLLGAEASAAPEAPASTWRARIDAATAHLSGALAGLDGLPTGLQTEISLKHLNIKLYELADRLGHLEQVLASPEHAPAALEQALREASDGARPMVQARLDNVARLRALQTQRRTELEQALALLDDLATRAHLARFTGDAGASVADELNRLAAAVDTGDELARVSARSR